MNRQARQRIRDPCCRVCVAAELPGVEPLDTCAERRCRFWRPHRGEHVLGLPMIEPRNIGRRGPRQCYVAITDRRSRKSAKRRRRCRPAVRTRHTMSKIVPCDAGPRISRETLVHADRPEGLPPLPGWASNAGMLRLQPGSRRIGEADGFVSLQPQQRVTARRARRRRRRGRSTTGIGKPGTPLPRRNIGSVLTEPEHHRPAASFDQRCALHGYSWRSRAVSCAASFSPQQNVHMEQRGRTSPSGKEPMSRMASTPCRHTGQSCASTIPTGNSLSSRQTAHGHRTLGQVQVNGSGPGSPCAQPSGTGSPLPPPHSPLRVRARHRLHDRPDTVAPAGRRHAWRHCGNARWPHGVSGDRLSRADR